MVANPVGGGACLHANLHILRCCHVGYSGGIHRYAALMGNVCHQPVKPHCSCRYNNNNNNNNNCIERCNSKFLPSPHCDVNCLQHVCSSDPGAIVCKSRAIHWAFIVCNMLYATWYKGTAQLLSLTEFKSPFFLLYFIGWTINRSRKGGNQSTQRKPPMTSFRKCHILKPENSSPKWDLNLHSSIGGRLGKQMYYPLHHVINC